MTIKRGSHRQGTAVVLGHLGGRNLGDEAMFYGLLEAEGSLEIDSWVLPVPDPDVSPSYAPNVRAIGYGAKSVLKAVIESDVLVVCGGTTFHDNYAGRKHTRHLSNLLKFVVLSLVARLTRSRVLLLGIGVGPFTRRPTRWLTNAWLGLASAVLVRDSQSYDYIVSVVGWLGPRRQIAADSDLATLLSYVDRGVRNEQSSKVLLINVMDASAFAAEFDQAAVGRFYDSLAEALVSNYPDHEYQIAAVGVGSIDNDYDACSAMEASLAALSPGCSSSVRVVTDPAEFVGLASAADLCVVTRLHAALLSHIAGASTISIVYHQKTVRMWRSLGVSPESHCVQGLDEGTMRKLLASPPVRPGDETFAALREARASLRSTLRQMAGDKRQ